MINQTTTSSNDRYEEFTGYHKYYCPRGSLMYNGCMVISEIDRHKGLRQIVINPKTLRIEHEEKISLQQLIDAYEHPNSWVGIEWGNIAFFYLIWRRDMLKRKK